MNTRLFSSMIFFVIALGVLDAQDKPTIKTVPLSPTSPTSGKEMFATYCAVCHGPDGRGAGPAAAALKTPPANLTQLTARNKGKFPDLQVAQTLSAKDVVAHGSQEMPVWGDLFKSVSRGDNDIIRLRVANLTAYIQSIQTK